MTEKPSKAEYLNEKSLSDMCFIASEERRSQIEYEEDYLHEYEDDYCNDWYDGDDYSEGLE